MFSQTLTGAVTELRPHRQRQAVMEDRLPQSPDVTELVIDNNVTLMILDANFVIQLTEKLQEALSEIRQLRDELSQRPLVSAITLYDLGANTLKVKMPISVVLHETDEESLARWPETRAYGIGGTLSEAISNLKQNIADLFFDLKSREPESLGEIALDTLRILETHLQNFQ
jgi:hypothetical protein